MLRRLLERKDYDMIRKIFGQLEAKWWKVIVFAVIMGVYTGLIATWVSPASWYHDIAVTPERWILPAVLIIINCKKPLEAAIKTFVFFLISQPLVYLVQVPFAEMGWQLFGYYKYWFMITLLTFPGGFIAWYIKKDNILSAIILSVALFLLTFTGIAYVKNCIDDDIGNNIGGAIYCFGVVILFVFAILRDLKTRLVAGAMTVVFGVGLAIYLHMDHSPVLRVNGAFDTEKYAVTFEWTVKSSDPEVIDAEITKDLSGNPDIVFQVYKNGEVRLELEGPEGQAYSFRVSYDKQADPDFVIEENE